MRTRLIALACAAPLVLAACGGSDSGSGGGTELTKDQWIAAADKICGEAKTAREALPEPQSAAELVTQVGSLTTILTKEMADLRALVPAEAEQAKVDEILAAASVQIDMAKGLAEVAKGGDLAAIQQYVTDNTARLDEAKSLAVSYGLKVCGSG